MNNTQESLFKQGKALQSQIQVISGIIQNPYLPTDVDPKQFHQDIEQLIHQIKLWEQDITAYYHNMTPAQKSEIQTLQQALRKSM